jgi:hypothetical protein
MKMAHIDFFFLVGLSCVYGEGPISFVGRLLNETTNARLQSCDIGLGLTDGLLYRYACYPTMMTYAIQYGKTMTD